MAHYLLRNEGVFVGPSAALNVVGAVKLARKLGPGCRVATVLCDGGERYRATTFNAQWLADKGLTPTSTGSHLGFVRDDPRDRPPLPPPACARLVGGMLDAMPAEWLGTTFRNAALVGREGFSGALHDLFDRKVASGAATTPMTTSEVHALGNAEDYLRVATNVSTALEAIVGRQAGHDVRRVFTFASPTLPILAPYLALQPNAVKLRVYYDNSSRGGGGAPPLTPAPVRIAGIRDLIRVIPQRLPALLGSLADLVKFRFAKFKFCKF